jgi:hypothetical protein
VLTEVQWPFAQLAKVHYTFANTPVDFRQLENVDWSLANTSCGLSPLANVRLLSVGEIREPRESQLILRSRIIWNHL